MAKKRYHQSAKDRLDESRGMERELRRKAVRRAEHYAGYDDRRRREMEDAGMLYEDKSQVANLPQEVIMKEYPKTDYFRYDLNDELKGIDVQMNDDVRAEKRKSGKPYPEKW